MLELLYFHPIFNFITLILCQSYDEKSTTVTGNINKRRNNTKIHFKNISTDEQHSNYYISKNYARIQENRSNVCPEKRSYTEKIRSNSVEVVEKLPKIGRTLKEIMKKLCKIDF